MIKKPFTILALTLCATVASACEITNYTTADGLCDNNVRAIAAAPAGAVLFTSSGGCVSKFKYELWTSFTDSTDSTGSGAFSNANAQAVDSAGAVWTGTSEGVERLQDGISTRYSPAEGLGAELVKAVAIDRQGTVWAGTSGGASQYQNGSWTNIISTINGLSSDDINAIAIDSLGNIWFGTNGGGLSKFSGEAWTNYSEASGLASDTIYALAVDSSGALWIGTDRGVSKLVDDNSALKTISWRDVPRLVQLDQKTETLNVQGFSSSSEISVYDLRGARVLHSANISAGSYDIKNLSRGTYLVNIRGPGGEIMSTVVNKKD